MAKYPPALQEHAKKFTPWVRPRMRKFKFACCDCGLVHDMKFRIAAGGVEFKLRRNKGETKKQRKRLRK